MELKELSDGSWFTIPDEPQKYIKINMPPFNAKTLKNEFFKFPDNQQIIIIDNIRRGN